MNSKQLNFFMVPEDIPLIYEFFNKQDIKYVEENTAVRDNQIRLEKFPYSSGERYHQICLATEEFKPDIFIDTDPNFRPFTIDIFKSKVLQFSPGGFYPGNPRELHRGRFYCPTSYFVSNGESVTKGDRFKAWVDKIFRLFKKEFLVKTDPKTWIYFSPGAINWMKANNGILDRACFTISM